MTDHDHILNALTQSSQGPRPADTRMIERCRDVAAGSLSGTLKGMLERLVDEFFTQADKAVQLDTQHLYFEAMATVRNQRERIEDGFRNHFIRGFDTAVRGETDALKNSNLDEAGEFNLVDADDLEESIALQEMAAKMKAGCRDELFALEKRMGALLHDADLTKHKNPLGAEVLAQAFIAACGETDASLKVRLLFVTMWDRHMQNGVLSMYHEVNQYLVEKGILPKIKHEIKRQGMSQVEQIATAAAHAAVQAMAMTDEDGDVFATMQNLFAAASARGGLPGGTNIGRMMGVPMSGGMGGAMNGGGGGNGAGGGFSTGVGAPNNGGGGGPGGHFAGNSGGNFGVNPGVGVAFAHNPILVTQLTQLQHGDAAALGAVLGAGVAIDANVIAMGNANLLRELKNTELGSTLGSADAMTLDIVAMLFDFIFDDRRVPDPIKALLGRLQIPVFKAAMLDQAFFSKKSHPTRRLLNVMADAATRWGDEITHESPLYRKVEQIVQRINTNFEDKLEVFEQAVDEFESFMAERERAADALVEVSINMIEAREREQIKVEDAQSAAEDAVRARASDSDVPEAVRVFLCKEWIKPLRHAYLEGGGECHAWLTTVALMDDLIWSVRPKLTRESRQYMVKTLPGLLRRLQQGMQSAEIEQAMRDQFMSQLVHCHAGAVKAGFQAAAVQSAEALRLKTQEIGPDETWKSALLARQPGNKPEAQETAVVLPFTRPEHAKTNGDVKMEIIRSPSEAGMLAVEEITIGSVGWIEPDDLDSQSEQQGASSETEVLNESAAKHLAVELKPGTWVEFRHQGEETMHAKLKWISPLKSAYLFTDRQGKRAATMPLDELAAAFRIGSACIVDDLPLLDRAVDNVIETLKQAAA